MQEPGHEPACAVPFAERLDAALAEGLTSYLHPLVAEAPELAELCASVETFVLAGGKRIRPHLLCAGWHAATGDPVPTAAVRFAVALELLHGFALAHDDIMDDSAERRGRPALHRSLGPPAASPELRRSLAILAGDLLFSASEWMTLDAEGAHELAPGRIATARGLLSSMHREMLTGQFLDLLGQASPIEKTEPLRVAQLKTASYTVERPLQIGLALGGAPDATIAEAHRFGRPLGVAFQLRDDLLGAFGDEALTGKPVGDDFREGKRTMLVHHAYGHLSPGDRDLLTGLIGDRSIDEDAVDEIRALLARSGAVEHVENLIATLRDEAAGALERWAIAPRGKELLAGYVEVLTARAG
jgi:geranylgeranyl diphosphate synthase, type I